jgi:hypothetical protein
MLVEGWVPASEVMFVVPAIRPYDGWFVAERIGTIHQARM